MRLSAIFFSFSIIFYGCSSNKFIRDIDYEAEFEKGKLALSNKKYVRAQDHFNTVVIGASHTELGDDALFYLGETYFYMGDKLLAIAEYDRLIRRMSFSPYVEKARYRICESYVILSPKYFRDQTYSEKAIEKLQEFIDDFADFVIVFTSPGPPSSDASLSSSHDELTILVNLIYEDTEELLEGLTAPDTGERRSAALESFNSNLDLFIERIEQVVASATSS